MMAINSSVFRIINNGKYEAEVKFFLSSEVKSEEEKLENIYMKDIFFIDKSEMKLGID